ncbi:MAG: pantoate--beta-alanine ligase, partial [Pseudomonadales bacterium]|nr:pantoate--beta-alanine ligase [Pseudomonadales bacterium]
MELIKSLDDLRQKIREHKQQGKTVALVPTMGNLHEGHITLAREAKKIADIAVASIFVNPTQFGANEDLDSYPRTLEADGEKLAGAGLDLLFTPSVDTMYPNGLELQASVIVPGLSEELCGATRPGHFTGVATVVSKLFNLFQPDIALFGEKDFQQLMVIKRFSKELAFPIQIIGVPTVREDNGLAMSSRNGYLTVEEKQKAAMIYKTLQQAKEEIENPRFKLDEKSIRSLCDHAEMYLTENGFDPEYFTVRRAEDLATP